MLSVNRHQHTLHAAGIHESLSPRVLSSLHVLLTPLVALLSFSVFLPSKSLLVGLSLVTGDCERRADGQTFSWAAGLVTAASDSDELVAWLESILAENAQMVRLAMCTWILAIASASALTVMHSHELATHQFSHLLVDLGSYVVKLGLHLLLFLAVTIAFLASASFAPHLADMPLDLVHEWAPGTVSLGPYIYVVYTIIAVTAFLFAVSTAQCFCAWHLVTAAHAETEHSADLLTQQQSRDHDERHNGKTIRSAKHASQLDDRRILRGDQRTDDDRRASRGGERSEHSVERPPPFHSITAETPSPAYSRLPASLVQGLVMHRMEAKASLPCRVQLVPEEARMVVRDLCSARDDNLNFEDIRAVRFGKDASTGRGTTLVPLEDSDRSILILYGGPTRRLRSWHLVATCGQHFDEAKSAFTTVAKHRTDMLGGYDQLKRREKAWLTRLWVDADTNCDDRVDLTEALQLCKRLDIADTRIEIERHFSIVDVDQDGYLDRPGFDHLIHRLGRRLDVEQLFNRLSHGSSGLPLADFQLFIRECQHSDADDAAIGSMYDRFSDGKDRMTLNGFSSFLSSPDNAPIADTSTIDSMHQPLCDYYISSSHNTYLVGNQFTSQSSVEGYIRALQQGCRCVEGMGVIVWSGTTLIDGPVDLWNGSDGEPVVTHGRTLTSRLSAVEAFTTIARYAFRFSPYPLILSLELHLSVAQQVRLVSIMREHFGPALLDAPLEGLTGLPSPNDLKYRILVKAKQKDLIIDLNVPDGGTEADEEDAKTSRSDLRPSSLMGSQRSRSVDGCPQENLAPRPSIPRRHTDPNQPCSRSPPLSSAREPLSGADALTSEAARESKLLMIPPSPAKSRSESLSSLCLSPKRRASDTDLRPKMASDMLQLLIYTVGVKFRGFAADVVYDMFHVFSLVEGVATKSATRYGTEMLAHCKSHLMRIYPSIARLNSSNPLPHHFWARGTQLVALNFQHYDLGMEMNAAFFTRNNGCGYVLRRNLEPSLPLDYVLEGKILSAQRLKGTLRDGERMAFPGAHHQQSLKPSVTVAIFPPSSQCSSAAAAKCQTSAVHGNALNPVFDASFQLAFTCSPEHLRLTFLEFRVLDGGVTQSIIGRFCVAVDMLKPGYRHLPLFDRLGHELLFSSLFVCTNLRSVPRA